MRPSILWASPVLRRSDKPATAVLRSAINAPSPRGTKPRTSRPKIGRREGVVDHQLVTSWWVMPAAIPTR
jgi:hypothetical protein